MKTEILMIVDDSGSMAPLAQDVNGSYDKFIAEQRAVPGEARVSLVLFNTEARLMYSRLALSMVPAMDLKPRGLTALFDAVGTTLEKEGKRIAHDAWADLVICCVITDGEENASRKYTQREVQDMVQHAEAHGWKFIFLAANQDAWKAAESIGTRSNMVQNFAASGQGVGQSYAYASVNTTNLRTGKQ